MTLLDSFMSECPLIAILRGIKPDEMLAVCDVLADEGIRLIEVPLNSPEALRSIGIAAAHYHRGGRLLVGAGTVLTPADVEQVAQAGGKYIISPNSDAAVIRRTVELGLVSIPGFLTPTEGFAAVAAGEPRVREHALLDGVRQRRVRHLQPQRRARGTQVHVRSAIGRRSLYVHIHCGPLICCWVSFRLGWFPGWPSECSRSIAASASWSNQNRRASGLATLVHWWFLSGTHS